TADRGKRPIYRAHYMTDFDVVRRAGKHVAAPGTFLSVNNASFAQLAQNGVKKFLWNIARLGDRSSLGFFSRFQSGKVDQSLERIFSFCCEHAEPRAIDPKPIIHSFRFE